MTEDRKTSPRTDDAGALSMEAALWLAMGLCAAVVVGVVIVVEVL